MITVPESLALQLVRDHDNERAKHWIDDFPFLARDILGAWDCQPDGEIRAGAVAVVIPVRSPMGPVVVKISYPLPGNADEHIALALWGGDGAVRLLDADLDKRALLLERLEDRQLDVAPDEGIAIGGQLLAPLAVEAPVGLKRLAETTAEWEQQVRDAQHQQREPLPGRVVDAAVETIRDLSRDPTTTMVHGDLHGRNILHSDRGWIVIDPKGLAGTPAYDALTMCTYLRTSVADMGELIEEFKRRIRIFSEAAEVDPDLSRRCAHARAVTALLWDLSRGDGPRTGNFEFRLQLSEGLID